MILSKENLNLKYLIEDLFKQEKYEEIYEKTDEIWQNFDFFQKTQILDYLIQSIFMIGNFEKVILMEDDFMRKGFESPKTLRYAILSFLSLNDVYGSLLLFKKSKIISEAINFYFSEEGAFYYNISVSNISNDEKFLYALVSFVLGLSKEVVKEKEDGYIVYRIIDFLNIINEMGFDEEIIYKFIGEIPIMFRFKESFKKNV